MKPSSLNWNALLARRDIVTHAEIAQECVERAANELGKVFRSSRLPAGCETLAEVLLDHAGALEEGVAKLSHILRGEAQALEPPMGRSSGADDILEPYL